MFHFGVWVGFFGWAFGIVFIYKFILKCELKERPGVGIICLTMGSMF